MCIIMPHLNVSTTYTSWRIKCEKSFQSWVGAGGCQHWLRHWQSAQKSHLLAWHIRWMKNPSLSTEFRFLSNWLTDLSQYFPWQRVHWFLIWTLCKIQSNENFLKRLFYSISNHNEQSCIIWTVFPSIF